MIGAPAFFSAFNPLWFFLLPILVVVGARRRWAYRGLWWIVVASYVITPVTFLLIEPEFVRGGVVGDTWVGAPWYVAHLWGVLVIVCVPLLLLLVHRIVWPDSA